MRGKLLPVLVEQPLLLSGLFYSFSPGSPDGKMGDFDKWHSKLERNCFACSSHLLYVVLVASVSSRRGRPPPRYPSPSLKSSMVNVL